MTTKKLTKLILKNLKTNKFKICGTNSNAITVSSTSKHLGNFVISVFETTLGLVTYIQVAFSDVHASVKDYICNIYPHEFDTINDLIYEIKKKETEAHIDIKHKYLVFCQERRQMSINFPKQIQMITRGMNV